MNSFCIASFSTVADIRGRFSKFREEGGDIDYLGRGILALVGQLATISRGYLAPLVDFEDMEVDATRRRERA